jgi:sugar lactone lactonase YvrE
MPATSANLSAPVSAFYDKFGNLYVVAGLRVFEVDTTGTLTVVAGNGVQDPDFGNGGPASQAEFGQPRGIALDAAGNIFISDNSGGQTHVRRIDIGSGVITQYASIADGPEGMAFDAAGNLYVAGDGVNRIYKVTTSGTVSSVVGGGAGCAGQLDSGGDGCLATQAILNKPQAVAFDGSGNMFIADFGNCWVRRVDAVSGIITRAAGSTCPGYSGDGGPATSAALGAVGSITLDDSGNMFICDHTFNVVRKVTGGIISTYAGNGKAPISGDGGPATSAQLSCSGMAADPKGNLAITDPVNGRVRLVTASNGIIGTYAGNGAHWYSGDGRLAVDAGMEAPQAIAIDANGDILISEGPIDNRIRRVDLHGVIATVAGVGEVNGVASIAPAGNGGPATSANIFSAAGVVVDGAGNIYIADDGQSQVRRVDAVTGVINIYAGHAPGGTVGCAAQTDSFGDGCPAINATLSSTMGSLGFDPSGNLLIADRGIGLIRRVDAKTQIITAVAGNATNGYSGDGGPATSAQLNNPPAFTVDSAGDLFIADTGNARIRRVDAKTGIITTAAGNGTAGFSGDGGPAVNAQISPGGVVVDSGGNLFLTDNLRVRRVDAATQIINTYAGNGTPDLSGDGGPAINAGLAFPSPAAINIDTCGNLLVQSFLRVRRIGDNPEVALSTPSTGAVNFSPQLITTSSSAQSFTVKNTGCIGLEIASIALADTTNFSESDNCSDTTVAPNRTCTVNVIFKPTAARLLGTTIRLATSDPGSPQIVNLAGNGTDFSIAAASGGSASATVTAGQAATYNLQVTPANGFTGSVAVSCTGAPSLATCSPSTTSVAVNGAAVAFNISVSTTAGSNGGFTSYTPGPQTGSPVPALAMLLLAAFMAQAFVRGRRRLGVATATLFLMTLWTACGGGGSAPPTPTPVPGTPKGTFTLVVTGTSGTVSRTMNLTLTVN